MGPETRPNCATVRQNIAGALGAEASIRHNECEGWTRTHHSGRPVHGLRVAKPSSDAQSPIMEPRQTRPSSLLSRHGADYDHRRPGRGLCAPCPPSLRHDRYRVPARVHVLPDPVRRPDGERRGGGGDRRAGRGDRPRAVLRPDGERGGAEGVPCGAPGHRDRVAPRRADPAPDLRHPGRRHGARLRQLDLLRPAGAAHHRRRARQVEPLHRLEPPPADRSADRLRGLRRDPPARRLPQALGRPGAARPHRLGDARDGRAHLARRPTGWSPRRRGSG